MNSDAGRSRPHAIPAAVAALLLFGALADWPYGYYTLLRFAVCAAGGYTLFIMYNWRRTRLVWLFGLVTVLFNPLIPVHLSRNLWRPIDVGCALLFVTVALTVKRKSESP